jgi:hypothetical protein
MIGGLRTRIIGADEGAHINRLLPHFLEVICSRWRKCRQSKGFGCIRCRRHGALVFGRFGQDFPLTVEAKFDMCWRNVKLQLEGIKLIEVSSPSILSYFTFRNSK